MSSSSPVEAFRALHAAQEILLLPNVWDAGSAALFRAAGAKAIATTSAGLAWSCGYPDGDRLPRAELLAAVKRIRRVTAELPLSVDIEAGYSGEPESVAELVALLIDAGVAGVNLEDEGADPSLLAAKIEAVARLRTRGRDVFVNARTDVYLRDIATADGGVRETIDRGRRYAAAGADGLFVPSLRERDAIASIARESTLPLAVFAISGLPAARELYALGVRRCSTGESLAALGYGAAREAATAFLRDGSSESVLRPYNVDYDQTNALFDRS
ncbi:MAG: isocitrate lyase/phosphoenolpyruvate mutase family protein [Candidatus Eremiobacteraeota bacterium]|nr:isocitrate lyase/phosphoenolpyruvate mutase family protein [Candidatus Eremiobacteraeota bacterium]